MIPNRELTYEEAAKNGINISMVRVCRKLRHLAKLDRLALDESEHRSGLNKHLFDYIEYCGYDVLEFVKQYMSNLQPYMLERRKDQECEESFICVMDNLYRISVYIKVDEKRGEEIIISFHENNKRGIAKSNRLETVDIRKMVPIFADTVLSKSSDENKYVVKALVQRGLKILPIELAAVKCQDVFIVEKNAISLQFISYCNDYIRELYTSDLDIDFDRVEVFTVLQQISFTSYGRDTFSSISLLIDSFNIQRDHISKAAVDAMLITYVQNLNLTVEQQDELKSLLDEKYSVTDIKKIDLIINRVKDNLSIEYNNELDKRAIEAHEVYTKITTNND